MMNMQPRQNPVIKLLQGLSSRERILIFTAVALAIVVVFALLLIMPSAERLTEANTTLSSAKSNRAMTDVEIAALTTYQKNYDDHKARHDASADQYQHPMQPEEIDRLITMLMEDCGFEPASLTLHPPVADNVAAFVAVPPSATTPLTGAGTGATANSNNAAGTTGTNATGTATTEGTAANASSTSSAATPATPSSSATDTSASTEGAAVQVYTVDVMVLGNEDAFFDLLDRVVPLTWLKIMSTSYAVSSTFETSGEHLYMIKLALYVSATATAKGI
jgi:cytoskeletal protein RodZ